MGAMGVEEFLHVAEGSIAGALEVVLKSIQELDELPRPLFKVVMEKLREKGKELSLLIPLGDGVALKGKVEVSENNYYHDGYERPHLFLGLFLVQEDEKTLKILLNEVAFRIEPRHLKSPARRILSQLPSETPTEALRVVEALEAWAEGVGSLRGEVEAHFASTLEREKEALEALKLRAAIRGLAEE